MTHAFHHQFDSLIKANKLYRLETELLDLKSNNNEKKIERIELLQDLIDQINARKDTQQIKEELIKNHIQLLKDSQYQKKWQFLNNIQKDDRIGEYIQRLNITDAIICSRLKKYVGSGVLKTKNITYNVPKGIIDCIDILTVDDNNNYHLKIMMDEDNEHNDTNKEDEPNNDKKISKSGKSIKLTKSTKSTKSNKSIKSKKIAKDNIDQPIKSVKTNKTIKSVKSVKSDNKKESVKVASIKKKTKSD
jgi:hypothetical protein